MDTPCKRTNLARRNVIYHALYLKISIYWRAVSMQKNHMDMAGMEFGLIFFASSETSDSRDKYRLVIESAKFADQHGFSSIWIPERHFTRDGWLYPNPAVLQAAIARETQHIHLRAGSVVLPLHNPIRVAEE